ncbi:MAG: protein translocase subunit SecF [Candidatus Delongbacteria bacterium]
MAKNRVNFIGKIKTSLLISAIIIVAGIISVVSQGGLNYNIEFSGGYLIHAGFYKSVDISQLRSVFSQSEIKGVEIQEFGDINTAMTEFETEVILKVKSPEDNIEAIEKNVIGVLDREFGQESYVIRQSSSIGPKVGDELKISTVKAILWALFFILLYITIKFRFRFGIAAIAALFHDVLVTVGMLSILGIFFEIEISLSVIAAVLTIVGYSLNDTIVVFDRIRENIKKLEGMEFDKLVNVSINETLKRTILTSLSTLLVVLILFLFGGEVIRDLSTTLLIGVIVGTYSSIFIAAPVLIFWEYKKLKKRSLSKA